MKWSLFNATCVAAALFGSSVASTDSNATKPQVAKRVLPRHFNPPEYFTVSKLERSIDLEKVYAKEQWDITIKNVGKVSRRDIYIPFTVEDMGRVGGFQVYDSWQKSQIFQSEAVAKETESPIEYYQITLDEALPPKEEKSLRISFNRLAALQPLPAEIEQTDSQFLQYTTSAYAFSAYPVDFQTLTIIFPSTKITDYTVLPDAEPKKGPRKLNYGPYKSIDPLAYEPISVRYEYTHALAHARLLERDIEVSHWGGNVAFEERYWLENLGATLKHHYSRVQWAMQLYTKGPTTAFSEMRIPLKGGTADAYFTDDIGNVSTSRFWSNSRAAELYLKPRYPLFGGWKYSFKIGWNGDSQEYLRKTKTGEGYVLKVPFLEGPKLGEGLGYERVQLRAILPEGSRNVNFATSVSLVENTTSLHSTFMDTVGRPTLTLTALNIVDEMRDAELIITYDLPWAAQYRKPLAVSAAMFAVFFVAWVIGNLDTSIGKKTVKM